MAGESAGPVALFFAATHPDRVAALALVGTWARIAWAPDYPYGAPVAYLDDLTASSEDMAAAIPTRLALVAPSAQRDPEFAASYGRLVRLSNAPIVQVAHTHMITHTDVRAILPTIRARTLVLQRRHDGMVHRGHARYLAEHIPGAELVELDGIDNAMYVGDSDSVVDEIEEFLTGARTGVGPSADRVLATVLFTDIVDSTATAAELGDRRWRALLDAHDAAVRRQLARFGGREVNTAGDGFLVTFDGPGRAIRCARAICDAVRSVGLEVRAGLHTGEVEVRGDDVAGLAVHIGARVAANASANEVLVSSAVPPLVAGSGIEFDDRGEHELKGVPGAWRLFAVRDGAP